MRAEDLDSCDDPCIEVVLDVVEVDALRLVSRHESEVNSWPVER